MSVFNCNYIYWNVKFQLPAAQQFIDFIHLKPQLFNVVIFKFKVKFNELNVNRYFVNIVFIAVLA